MRGRLNADYQEIEKLLWVSVFGVPTLLCILPPGTPPGLHREEPLITLAGLGMSNHCEISIGHFP